MNTRITIKDQNDIVLLRNKVQKLSKTLLFSNMEATKLASYISEISREIIKKNNSFDFFIDLVEVDKKQLSCNFLTKEKTDLLGNHLYERFFDITEITTTKTSYKSSFIKTISDQSLNIDEELIETIKKNITRLSEKELLHELERKNIELEEAYHILEKSQKELLDKTQQLAKVGGWEINLKDMSISGTDEVSRIHDLPLGEIPKVEDGINFYAPEARPIIAKAVNDGIENGTPWDLELPFITAKGNHKWVRAIGIPEVKDNKTVRLTGVFQDITEQRVQKMQLEESNLRFQMVVEGSGAGIWDWININDSKEWWSPKFYELLGYKNNEIEASLDNFSNMLHPKDKQITYERLEAHFKKEKPFELEYRLKTKSGKYKWFNVTGQAIWNEKGEPIRMVGTIIDINKTKLVELKLEKTKQFFEKVTNIVPSIIYVFNQKTLSNEYSNREIGATLGYTEKEIKNLGVDLMPKLCHPDDLPKIGAHFEAIKSLKDAEIIQVEYRMKHKNGNYKWLLSNDSVFERDQNKKVLKHIGVATDITPLKKVEELVQEQVLQLKNKNKELEQFVYVASHDLQEPLRTMSSYVDLLGKLYKDQLDYRAVRSMTHIENASLRMKTLIKDLLDYSRLGKEKIFKEVNCNEQVAIIISDLEFTIKDSNASIEIGDLPIIIGLEIELKQLFQNLISNAIKFRKKGESPKIKITVKEKNNEWLFCVQDQGIGMEEEHLERIFTIFQRLHNRDEYAGTGIGLSLCKKIVEMHKGEIWVESKVNKGSKFYFTIPKNIKRNEEEI